MLFVCIEPKKVLPCIHLHFGTRDSTTTQLTQEDLQTLPFLPAEKGKKPIGPMVELMEPKPVKRAEQPPPSRPKLIFWLIGGILLVAAYKGTDFIEVGKDGELRLSKKRQEKLEREIENLKEAEQYVLVALYDGWFPCYNCGASTQIYLKRGEVWKYGVTINGEKGRYGGGLTSKKLFYIPQYHGSLEKCMIEERKKYTIMLCCQKTRREKNP